MAKYPYSITFFCLAMAYVATRIITGFRASMKTDAASGPQPIHVLAYWIPWIGYSFQFATKFQDSPGGPCQTYMPAPGFLVRTRHTQTTSKTSEPARETTSPQASQSTPQPCCNEAPPHPKVLRGALAALKALHRSIAALDTSDISSHLEPGSFPSKRENRAS
jgi:hypothetical protein